MNDFKIEVLRGADRIRKRPGVVFGSDGVAGAINAIKMLLEVFLAEAALGFSRGIDVVIHKDESVSIHSLDDGLVLSDALVKGKPAWHHLFCDFAVGPREVEESHFFSLGEKHNQLFGRDFPKQKTMRITPQTCVSFNTLPNGCGWSPSVTGSKNHWNSKTEFPLPI